MHNSKEIKVKKRNLKKPNNLEFNFNGLVILRILKWLNCHSKHEIWWKTKIEKKMILNFSPNFLKEFSSSGFALTGDALKYERQRYDGWCDPAFCYCCCYCYYHWYHGFHHCCKWQQIQLQIGTTTWRIRTGAQWITASPGRLQRRTGALKKKAQVLFKKRHRCFWTTTTKPTTKVQVLFNDKDKTKNLSKLTSYTTV